MLTITGPQPTDRSGHGQGYADDLSLRISAPVPAPAVPTPPQAHVPGYDHVFVVMMENQDYSGIIGNKAVAPYLNSLIPKGASLTNAMAETHPSDPNYVALAGGSLFGVTDNTPFTSTVSPAWKTQRSLVIITFDEDAADGQKQSQRIPTLVLGSPGVRADSTSAGRYTHYSVLRTVEAALNLPNLTKNDLYADPIAGIWK